ncbi:MAG: hypothetical protein CBC09_07480 [Cellvibrionales bacterium TMED49]|nr:MAG: hypothetical protein CBC09_07480 [Cellvibrionales bacterium TMED49]
MSSFSTQLNLCFDEIALKQSYCGISIFLTELGFYYPVFLNINPNHKFNIKFVDILRINNQPTKKKITMYSLSVSIALVGTVSLLLSRTIIQKIYNTCYPIVKEIKCGTH